MTSLTESLSLEPARVASGRVDLPGSKSISNRVLLLAALCRDTTDIQGLLESDDTRVMLAALEQLGVQVTRPGADSVRVRGGVPFGVRQGDLFLGNADRKSTRLNSSH